MLLCFNCIEKLLRKFQNRLSFGIRAFITVYCQSVSACQLRNKVLP